jgi:hypothetical protein
MKSLKKSGFPIVAKVTLEDLMNCGAYNHDFMRLSPGVTWDEVKKSIEEEQAAFKEASGMSPEEGEGFLEEEAMDSYGFCHEVGVNAAILGLTAAGCLTVSSCRGGKMHVEWNPVNGGREMQGPSVCFYINPILAPVLVGIASSAGLEITYSTAAQNIAIIVGRVDDPTALLRLAQFLHEARNDIDALGDARYVLSIAEQQEYETLLDEYGGDPENADFIEAIENKYAQDHHG